MEETLQRAREKFLPLVGRNLQFWLPVQIVQFEFVPLELQVTWVAAFGLLWKIILSTLAGNAKADSACAADVEECLLPEDVVGVVASTSTAVGSAGVCSATAEECAAGRDSAP